MTTKYLNFKNAIQLIVNDFKLTIKKHLKNTNNYL